MQTELGAVFIIQQNHKSRRATRKPESDEHIYIEQGKRWDIRNKMGGNSGSIQSFATATPWARGMLGIPPIVLASRDNASPVITGRTLCGARCPAPPGGVEWFRACAWTSGPNGEDVPERMAR